MLGKIEHDEVFVVDPEMRSTETLARQRFEPMWTGQLLENGASYCSTLNVLTLDS
jgi:hypothetical protein